MVNVAQCTCERSLALQIFVTQSVVLILCNMCFACLICADLA